MINLSLNKQLGIVMPSTNRALAAVLEKATQKELDTILKEKDLKSIVSSLLKDSVKSSASDKILLDIAKNNPTLKELGNVSNTIKELLNTLKSDKNPLPIEATLKKFLIDIKELGKPAPKEKLDISGAFLDSKVEAKELKGPVLKQKFENSGIFLESKLKNAQNPQFELKNLLLALEKNVAKSEMPSAKAIYQNIKELLSNPVLKEASNSAILQAPKSEAPVLKEVAKSVENIVSKLKENLKSADITTTKGFEKELAKLEHLISPKLLSADNFKLQPIQDTLQQLSLQLSQSSKPEAGVVLDSLGKIVESLNGSTLDVLLEKGLPKEIQNIIEPLKSLIEKSDPLFSKEANSLTSKLAPFINPERLAVHDGVKEILSEDLKAVLLKTSDEISKSSHPNQAEILKHVDKLLLQIDYFQLLSHLSNSSSLYLPFSWESLEEGNINIKKDKEDKFYCDIDLKLKEYGELKLKLALYEENQINIHIYSNSSDFKDIVKENIGVLRSALIESQITPREIRIFDALKKKSPYDSSDNRIDMGFEVKV